MVEENNIDNSDVKVFVPTDKQGKAIKEVMADFERARIVVNRGYAQFNGRNLYETIDDWTKRWNGYIPARNPLLDEDQSQIFLNFTRNMVISFLSKVASQPPKAEITAVNKKSGLGDQKFAEVLKDLVAFSDNAENAPARFMETALEATVKGTAIVYEGYRRTVQELEVPTGEFDMETGEGKFEKKEKVTYDNCYRKVWPLEDVYILNAYQPDIQKQPAVILREITTKAEAEAEFGGYKLWEFVKPGQYSIANDATTFYRNKLITELGKDQVEVLRWFKPSKGQYRVLINGIPIYDGPNPFKDGKVPLARYIFEPYENNFFWGMGFPQKIMGEQDLKNTFVNMMADKTFASLLPFGLSSDLDDIVEDEFLAPNKIRKVSDINKWRFETLPGVTSGEMGMLQMIDNMGKENSGIVPGGAQGPKGGKVPVRTQLLAQQEAMQKIGYNIGFLEDGEQERVPLRINHILQFYSIPKIEKITGKRGKEIEQLTYRDIRLSGIKLSDGKQGNKIIKLVEPPKNQDARQKIADELATTEAMGEISGQPTEALAVDVDTLTDYNFEVQVVRYSSYLQNSVLETAKRQEFANWRLSLAQLAPIDAVELIKWVEESYDIDSDRFAPKPGSMQQNPMMQQMAGQQAPGGMQPAQQMAPSSQGQMSNALG